MEINALLMDEKDNVVKMCIRDSYSRPENTPLRQDVSAIT